MTIKIEDFKNTLPKYKAAVDKFQKSLTDGTDVEIQNDLYAEAMNTLANELQSSIEAKNESKIDEMIALASANKGLTSNEIKFFNALDTSGAKTELVLPEETINEVFDDLKTNHPLLSIVNFKNAGLRLKALKADATGTAVWGNVFSEIVGQLNQTFTEDDFSQNKLTAFVVLPKDALEHGAAWLKTFVMQQIEEAFSVALEGAIVNGNGANQPVGLTHDVVTTDGIETYPAKTSMADLTALTPETAPKLLAPVMKYLSVKENGIQVDISGQVTMLVNPADYYDVEAKFTSLNANGVYTFVLPFGIKIEQSAAVAVGTAVVFVANRYDAFVGGATTIKEYDQTLAMEDLQLYTAKSFYYGKPKDTHTAAVVTIGTPAV